MREIFPAGKFFQNFIAGKKIFPANSLSKKHVGQEIFHASNFFQKFFVGKKISRKFYIIEESNARNFSRR